MPLTQGKTALEAELLAMYTDIGQIKSVPEFARRKAQAIYTFAHTGVPMTIITTFGGAVVGAMTAGSVKGTGLGGFDKPVPGVGLSSAKSTLKQDLIRIWTHGNMVSSAQHFAHETAEAIFKYYSQTMILTKEDTYSPMPAPPPVGPVTGPIFGKGGTLLDAYGTGFDAAKPILENELIRIWNQIDYQNLHTVEQFAIEMSEAIHAFCIQGKVDTIGTFTAPAAVALPPAPPNGAYFPGVGAGSGLVT